MVKKIYNVVLQSAIGASTSTVNESFFYDWTQIPDVPYTVSFTFASAIATLTNTQVASIYVDLTQSYNQLASAQSVAGKQYKSSFLGSLLYTGTGASNYLFAEMNTNPPTFLNGRPRNNNFLVEIHYAPTIDYSPATGTYCLILSFQEC